MIGLLIIIFFIISIIKLPHPGVNNDQLMFVDAATLNLSGEFIWKSWQKIPIMIFPYIGALKSYLYLPIFKLLGVSIWSIRLPHILITCFSLYILAKSLQLNLSYRAAILTILFLSIDPSLISFFRIDTGPNVLEFFLKATSLYLFFNYLKSRNFYYLLLIPIVLMLGIFNKLNFFWFINAFLISLTICNGRQILHGLDKIQRSRILIYTGVSYLFCLWFFMKISREVALSYQGFSDSVSLLNLSTNLPIFINNLAEVVSGSAFFKLVYGEMPTSIRGIYTILCIGLIIYGSYLIIKEKNKVEQRQLGFYLLLFIITGIQILLTKKATQPWHTLALYPFLTIVLSISICKIYQGIKKKYILIILFGMIIYLISVNIIYILKYSSPTKLVAYSSTIYELINYTKKAPQKFICLDTDICNQLRSFDPIDNKYFQPLSFSDQTTFLYTFSTLLGKFEKPDNYLYITHSDLNSHFPEFKKSLFNYIDHNNLNRENVLEINDGSAITFEIWKIGYFSK